ncbi:MAG TPA: MarR family transcriptional regulator [Thermodesulfobacteriota bacterium]|nr:MarR family transcriptional regulator [Thermodesulfobacteriota bacterium]
MPTRHRGSARERRALDAFVKLMRAADSLGAELARCCAGFGLTHAQLGVLEALWARGPMSQRELAGALRCSQANVTTVLDNLERQRLVRRRRDPRDRRVVEVSLTPAGRRATGGVLPARARRIAELLAPLTAAEQRTLGRLCEKLGQGAARPRRRAGTVQER